MPNAQCPMPNALFPMPYSQCPIPNALFPIPNALFPIPYALCPIPNALFPIVNSNELYIRELTFDSPKQKVELPKLGEKLESHLCILPRQRSTNPYRASPQNE